MKNKSTVLVTGAVGFIGSHLVEELVNRRYKVISLDIGENRHSYYLQNNLNRKSEFVSADIRDFQKVSAVISAYKPEYIFHLAASALVGESTESPRNTLDTNIMGTVNILEAIRRNPQKKVKGIIIASSDKAYGSLKKEKYLETDPLSGEYPYEVSKSCADLIAQMYFKTYGLPVSIARFGNVYGEGDLNFSRIVPAIMKAVVKDRILQIRSNGKFVRDYVYVRDVVKGYLLLAEHPEKSIGQAFNFGSSETLSVLELIAKAEKVVGVKIRYRILDQAKNEIPCQKLDFSKAGQQLHWSPSHTLDKTLPNIYRWYRNSS